MFWKTGSSIKEIFSSQAGKHRILYAVNVHPFTSDILHSLELFILGESNTPYESLWRGKTLSLKITCDIRSRYWWGYTKKSALPSNIHR